MEELIEKFRYKKNKAAFAQSKIKYLDRMERIEDPKSNEKSFNARFVPNVKGGKRVLEVQDLTIGYDQPLCTVNLEVMQSAKIAVIGKRKRKVNLHENADEAGGAAVRQLSARASDRGWIF